MHVSERKKSRTLQAKMSKKLLKVIGKTNAEFKLIGEGEKVLVGLSGGKDSLALVHALKHIQRHAPFEFGHGGVLKGLNRRATKKPHFVVSDMESLQIAIAEISKLK